MHRLVFLFVYRVVLFLFLGLLRLLLLDIVQLADQDSAVFANEENNVSVNFDAVDIGRIKFVHLFDISELLIIFVLLDCEVLKGLIHLSCINEGVEVDFHDESSCPVIKNEDAIVPRQREQQIPPIENVAVQDGACT